VTAIIKIKIGKRSVPQGEVLLQISYASAAGSVRVKETPNSLKTFSFQFSLNLLSAIVPISEIENYAFQI
jgi:hypothetical protein